MPQAGIRTINRRWRFAIAMAAMPALLVLPGCVGMAVRSIHETIAPSQPVLRDSVVFFSGGIRATAVLVPVKKGRLGAAAFVGGEDQGSNLPGAGYGASMPGARMVLLTVLTSGSAVTAEVKVRSETSALGTTKDRTVALAPGQRVMLEPFWSARDQNLQNLGVTLTLELSGVVEENRLMLAQVRKP
jgi:hypothetical protein